MAYRRDPFAVGEWYHCFSRGVDKRIVFTTDRDYERFLESLYLSNDVESTGRDSFRHISHTDIFQLQRGKQIVSIAAYCLMPNHFHILVQQLEEGGITKFMRKVGTGYTMYFNIKNERVGNLFVKPFRSKLVNNDGYFMHIPQYIHLNPVEVFEAGWKKGIVRDVGVLESKMRAYKFSSLHEYDREPRVTSAILDSKAVDLFRTGMPELGSMLEEASEYYRSTEFQR